MAAGDELKGSRLSLLANQYVGGLNLITHTHTNFATQIDYIYIYIYYVYYISLTPSS